MDRCKYCNAPLSESAKFCTKCGKKREAFEKASVYTEAEFVMEEPDESQEEQAQESVPVSSIKKDSETATEKEPRSIPQSQPSVSDRFVPPQSENYPEKKRSGWKIASVIFLVVVALGMFGKIFLVPQIMNENKSKDSGTPQKTETVNTEKEPDAMQTQATVSTNETMSVSSRQDTLTEKASEQHSVVDREKETAREKTKQYIPDAGESRVVSIIYKGGTVVGLRENGTVALSASREGKLYGLDTSEWTNIIEIACGKNCRNILGLQTDGKIATTGVLSAASRKKIQSWTDIVDLAVYEDLVFAVRTDGTVVGAETNQAEQRYDSMIEVVAGWKDIESVRICGSMIYGRKKDGTWIGAEGDFSSFRLKWYTDAAEIYGNGPGVAVYPNGDVKMIALSLFDYDLSSWTNIKKIIPFISGVIGLKTDGTVQYTSSQISEDNEFCENLFREISSWTDIVDIDVDSSYNAVGLKEDGSLVIAGITAEFNAEDWKQGSTKDVKLAPRILPLLMVPAPMKDLAEKKQAVNALKKAEKSKLGIYAQNSRIDYARYLKDSFPDEDVIWYALENSGINWKSHALTQAKKCFEEGSRAASRFEVKGFLQNQAYNEEEIEYVLKTWNPDFREMAVKQASSYLRAVKDKDWTFDSMVWQLENNHYTHEEAVYAAGKVGLN